MSDGPYFVDAEGCRHYYSDIASAVRAQCPHLIGRHIFEQLDALKLSAAFRGGTTPFSLPYTFT
mgnify:FL=1